MEPQHPELGRSFAVPNGGHRHGAVAGKLRAEGVKRGIPDVFNLTACRLGGEHFRSGLVLEFKVGKNRLTPEQSDWCEYLREQGYSVHVPRSWVEAALITIEYFGLPESLKKNLPAR